MSTPFETAQADFPPLLTINEEYNVLICIPCGYAILLSGVKDHLRKMHTGDLTSVDMRNIVEHFQQFALTLPTSRRGFQRPSHPINKIPYLTVKLDGICCYECPKILVGPDAEDRMTRHNRESHGFVVYEGREKAEGRPTDGERIAVDNRYQVQWHTIAACQRMYANVAGADNRDEEGEASPCWAASYFEVLTDTPAARIVHDNKEFDEAACDEHFSLRRRKRNAVLERNRTLLPQDDLSQVNPFLTETGFQNVLGDIPAPHVLMMRQKPNRDDPASLHALWNAVLSMLKVCTRTLKTTSRMLRIEITNEDASGPRREPFRAYRDEAIKHGIYLQYIFMFFARTMDRPAEDLVPQYTLNGRQRTAWLALMEYLNTEDMQTVQAAIDKEDSRTVLLPVERLCHTFFLSLIEQQSQRKETDLALYIAIACICVNGQGFQNAGMCGTILSALKKVIKFAFIQKLAIEYPDPSDDSSGKGTPFDAMREWTEKWMSSRHPTPMQWILSLAAFAKAVQDADDMDGFVTWENGNVTIRNVTVNMLEFKNMIHSLYEATVEALLDISFSEKLEDLPSIPWDELHDKPSFDGNGWHLFSSENSPVLATGDDFIYLQMKKVRGSAGPVKKEWITTSRFDTTEGAAEYKKKVLRFRWLFMILMHYVYGQLARGTELMSTYYCNTAGNGLRNLFLVRGVVCLISRYHKGYNASRTPRIVYRFLPRHVSTLLVYYLWLVLPYAQTVSVFNGDSEAEDPQLYSGLLFAAPNGKAYTDSTLLSRKLEWASKTWMHMKINARLLRHLIIAIGRRIMGKDSMVDIISEQDLAILRGQGEETALELQSGHSAIIGEQVYAKLVNEVFTGSNQTRQLHYRLSTYWHEFLGFDLVPQQVEEMRGRKRTYEETSWQVADPVQSVVSEERIERESKRRAVDVTRLLRDHFGAEAHFRGKQEEAIQATMDGENYIAYFAGTGSGKSLSIFLPALSGRFGLMIVIVPMVSLRQDLAPRFKALGIRYADWNPQKQREDVDVLLAMPEHIATKPFESFVQRTYSTGRLARIVVDECHYVLFTSAEFRPQLKRLREIVTKGTPITYLSATVPPSEEWRLWGELGLRDAQIRTIREPTRRSNIQYEVKKFSSPMDGEAIAKYLRGEEKASPGEKRLAYIQDKNLSEEVAQILDCDFYHGGMTLEQRQEVLTKFDAAPCGILLATSALNHGYHATNIRRVFSFGSPENLMQYSQESGRAGRDGQPAIARIIIAPGLPSMARKSGPVAAELVKHYLHGPQGQKICRRRVFSEYLDGDSSRKICRMSEELVCDVCAGVLATARHQHTLVPSTPRTKVEQPVIDDEFPFCSDEEELMQEITLSTTTNQNPVVIPAAHGGSILIPLTPPTTQRLSSPGHTEFSLPKPRYNMTTPRNIRPNDKQPDSQASTTPMTMWTPTPTSAPRRHLPAWSRDNSSVPPSLQPYASSPTSITQRQARERRIAVEAERNHVETNRTLADENVRACVEYWAQHCISCYSRNREWNHARVSCGGLCGNQSKTMRSRLNLQQKYGMCINCLLGPGLCRNFTWIPGEGDTAGEHYFSRRSSVCINGKEMQDVWAMTWHSLPKERKMLAQRMREEGVSDNPDDVAWGQWYSKLLILPEGGKVSRIVSEVEWITREHFMKM